MKVRDRVIYSGEKNNGKPATVVYIDESESSDDDIAIEFDEPITDGSNCLGHAKQGYGLWTFEKYLRLLSDDESDETETKEESDDLGDYNTEGEIDAWALLPRVMKSSCVHRFLLYGPPGTGKTTLGVNSANGKGYHNITLHEDFTVAEFLGHWIEKGEGYEWHYGSASLAMKEGSVLILNEIDHASGPVMTKLLNILDDISIAGVRLANNEKIKPAKGFQVVATMNGLPEDLPVPLQDRFDVAVEVNTPSPDAVNLLPEDLQRLVRMAYSNIGDVGLHFRQILKFGKLRGVVGDKHAAKNAFGDDAEDILNKIKIGPRKEDV